MYADLDDPMRRFNIQNTLRFNLISELVNLRQLKLTCRDRQAELYNVCGLETIFITGISLEKLSVDFDSQIRPLKTINSVEINNIRHLTLKFIGNNTKTVQTIVDANPNLSHISITLDCIFQKEQQDAARIVKKSLDFSYLKELEFLRVDIMKIEWRQAHDVFLPINFSQKQIKLKSLEILNLYCICSDM